MPESTGNFKSMPGLINKTMAAAPDTTSVIVPFSGCHAMSIIETYNTDATHTLVATPTLELSNNWTDNMPAANVRWTQVTDPSITLFLTTDNAASPPGGKPNGAIGNASLQIDPLRCKAFRWTITWVSGTGTYQLDIEAE